MMNFQKLILFIALIHIPLASFADKITETVQKDLNILGFDAGPVDGSYGKKTKGALEAFYDSKGMSFDGKLDANEVRDLKSALDSFRPKNLPNHQRYRNIIRTSLRDLKVNKKMSLVDDFEKLMSYHKQHTIYKDDENSGPVEWYSNMINFQECVPDLSRTNTMRGSKNAPNFGAFTNFCHNMIAHQFHINPTKNISHYKRIIDFWLENKTLENANSIQKAMGKESYNYAYALSTNVAKVMAHFSIYHPLYKYSATQMQNIEKMFETFARTYDYYSAFVGHGQFWTTLCNLKNPTTPKGANDHCGSFNTRMAVGATLLGIELGNQVIFDKGIQHVEIMLATFDKHKTYTSQIYRHDGLAYADQVNPAIDQLDYAIQKAFGIDFANMKNLHGVSPGEVYQHIWNIANDPTLLLPYMRYKHRNDPHFYENVSDYNGQNMFKVIKDIETGKRKPSYVWQAFNEKRYILGSPGLAKEFQPELWQKRKKYIRMTDYDYGGHIAGFSPLIIRMALQ